MNNSELNERLAKAMGYSWYWPDCKPPEDGYWDNGDETMPGTFSPTTSRDDFALVLDEVAKRGEQYDYMDNLWCELGSRLDRRPEDNEWAWFLANPPLPIACECALKALEG